MAKKLTQETLERMVMQVLNESKDVNEILGAIKRFMGGGEPTRTPMDRMRKGPKLGTKSDFEQLLSMIQLDPKVPQHIKDYAADVLVKSTPKLPTANITELPPDIPDEVAPTASSIPTVAMTDKEQEIARQKTAAFSSPKAVAGPTMGKRPAAPSLSGKIKSNVPTAAQFGRVGGMKESKELEALIAEVLAEISDKERRDLEAHYGPDMRGAEASKKQLDKIDAAIKQKKERLKKLKDLKGLRGHYGEDVSGKKQNDKKIAELEKEIKQLEAELGSKKTAKK